MPASVDVLSDVHGVLPVLDAVLAEPDVAATELVVVTGDHAAGPMPVQVLDRLAGLGDRCVLVRGNTDRDLVAAARGGGASGPLGRWAAAQLRPDQVELLAGLPHPVVLDLDGFGPVAFCHGTPRDDDEVVLVDTRLERWGEVFAELAPEIRTVVCGHTHMPFLFLRLVDRRLVVNPGSIGMPFGRAGGAWAMLRGGQVELRHTTVDIDAAVAAVVRNSGYRNGRRGPTSTSAPRTATLTPCAHSARATAADPAARMRPHILDRRVALELIVEPFQGRNQAEFVLHDQLAAGEPVVRVGRGPVPRRAPRPARPRWRRSAAARSR